MFSWFRSPHGWIKAKPNPVPTTEQQPNVGATTLQWHAYGTEIIEVRLGAPDGPLVCRSGPQGKHATGHWVADGTSFYLQNALAKKPHSLLSTLGVVRVKLAVPHFAPAPAPVSALGLTRAAAAGAVGDAVSSAGDHAGNDAGDHVSSEANNDANNDAGKEDIQEGEHLTALRTSAQAAWIGSTKT